MDIYKLTLDQIFNSTITFFLIFISVFIGGFCRNQYQISNGKKGKYQLSYLLICTFSVTWLLWAFVDTIMKMTTIPIFMFLCFLMGTGSNFIIDYFFDGTFLRITINILFRVKQTIVSSIMESIAKEKEIKKEEKDLQSKSK